MSDAGAGWLEADLDLDVGIYEYKFRHGDDDWRLDPSNGRTRSARGQRNSLLVVGGTDEPVLHVPARPYSFVDDDGRLIIRAGLRRGAGDRLQLRWDEGDGPRAIWMHRVGEEDEHLLFEVALPGAGSRVDYTFVLAGGEVVGAGGAQSFRVAPGRLRVDAPAWWRDAVVYTVLVNRFRRGGGAGAWPDRAGWQRDRACGGDLYGVIEALPHLCELGVTAVHLTPICPAPSPHRYDAVNPRRVAPELGGEAALLELVAAAHARGLRVIADIAVTHVDRGHAAFRDVAERGPESPYWDWFHIYAHPFGDGLRPGYRHYQKGQWREPLLDTSNPEVQDYLVATFVGWARAGIDGFRVDAAADVPRALCRRIRRAVRAVRADAVVFGEVVPAHIERWTAGALDAATDFASREALVDWLARGTITAPELAAETRRRRFRRGGPGWTAIAFTGTHDQPRIGTVTGDPRLARLGLLRVLTGAAVPMLYYGDEVGLASDQPERTFEDSWPDRQPMPWRPESWDRKTHELVTGALALRRRHRALGRGDELPLALDGATDDLFAVRRAAGDDVCDVVLNRGDSEVVLPLGSAPARLALVCGRAALKDGGLVLGPRSGAVLDRAAPPLDLALAVANAELAARAARAGMAESPALPTMLYLTVTEACNLRCRHCITGAPARTREGRARTMRPWVLDALREPLAAADYVAFTHGGESLVSPELDDVLRAIRRARGPRSGPVIHLATNGMLLTPERARGLLDLGLSSVMVSIDGASAATNDTVRFGSKLDVVLANVRALVELRARTRADLRVGVSTVVGRGNLAELAALGRLARDLGIDWLKIEETYPINAFARRDLVAPRGLEMRAAARALSDELAGSNIVLVDHLSPPAWCRCQAGEHPEVVAFRDADDYANRFRFTPCRAPWEIACIDPDGTVHALDYAHPALGCLAEHDFHTLWNSPAAAALRTTPAGC